MEMKMIAPEKKGNSRRRTLIFTLTHIAVLDIEIDFPCVFTTDDHQTNADTLAQSRSRIWLRIELKLRKRRNEC